MCGKGDREIEIEEWWGSERVVQGVTWKERGKDTEREERGILYQARREKEGGVRKELHKREKTWEGEGQEHIANGDA